jgi:tol-pal system protein YbgF
MYTLTTLFIDKRKGIKVKSNVTMFAHGLTIAVIALCAGCAGTAPKTQGDAILPEIDVVQVKENSEEALKAAQEAKREIEAINGKLAEIDNKHVSPSGDSSGASRAKIEEIENRLAFLAEAVKDLQAKVAALQDASNPRSPVRGAQPGPSAALPLPAASGGGPENDAYQNALRAFNSRNYEQAQKLFSDIIKQYPSGAYADNCWYWSGECSYAMLDWTKAISLFQKVAEFTGSSKADDAQLKLGMCYMKTGQAALAKAEFRKLIERYPGSEYVPRAQKYLSEMK